MTPVNNMLNIFPFVVITIQSFSHSWMLKQAKSEDSKGVIRSRDEKQKWDLSPHHPQVAQTLMRSFLNRQYNGHQKKDKQTNNGEEHCTGHYRLSNTLKTEDELRCSRRVINSCSTSDTRPFTVIKSPK